MTLGQIIRHHRDRLGLTQAQLADRAKLRQSRIAALEADTENGRPTNPTLDRLHALARGLGMPLWKLLKGLEDQS
jgi:transcriptional regulator with XRE-family HTH domain